MRGKKTGGRRKGTRNKSTRLVREAIEGAAAGLGGVARLIKWAKEDPANERLFWSTLYPRLLPLQAHDAAGNGGITVVISPTDAEL
jgi:hypothetical protein